MQTNDRLPALAVAVLLLVAILPLPYGYYPFLRLAVTAAAIWFAYREYHSASGLSAFVIVFVAVGLLFNPIVPVYLSKEVWRVLDILAAGAFAGWFWMRQK